MRKIIFAMILLFVISLILVSCNNTSETSDEPSFIPLESDEIDVVSKMGSDVIVINDASYIETVSELKEHTSQFKGKVYQLEGKFTIIDDQPYVMRTLVNGDEKLEYGFPLDYLEKDIAPNAWVRVTGIIGFGEVDGETTTVLQIVAIESIPTPAQTDIPWDGSEMHHHH